MRGHDDGGGRGSDGSLPPPQPPPLPRQGGEAAGGGSTQPEGRGVASGSSVAARGAGGAGGGRGALAEALVVEGMDALTAASVGRTVTNLEFSLSAEGSRASLHDGGDSDAGPGRAAEGALRLLLLREHSSLSLSTSANEALLLGGGKASAAAIAVTAATAAATVAVKATAETKVGQSALRAATDRLCILLSVAELRSEPPRSLPRDGPAGSAGDAEETSMDRSSEGHEAGEGRGKVEEGVCQREEVVTPGAAFSRLAEGAAEDFGVGAVERGVGYALAAVDGRAALDALRSLLQRAENDVKALREAGEGDAAPGGGVGAGQPEGGEDEVRALGSGQKKKQRGRGSSLGRVRVHAKS